MNNELRTCMVSYVDVSDFRNITTVEEMGYFHCWAKSSGAENGTVAIVELLDGKVIEALPTQIRFINNNELN